MYPIISEMAAIIELFQPSTTTIPTNHHPKPGEHRVLYQSTPITIVVNLDFTEAVKKLKYDFLKSIFENFKKRETRSKNIF